MLIVVPAAIIVFVAFGVFIYEKNYDFINTNVKYYTVVSTKDHYEKGEPIEFISFNESYTVNDMKWHEIVFCDTNDNGLYNYFDETDYVDPLDYITVKTFSDPLLNLFERQNYNSKPSVSNLTNAADTSEILRNYARENSMETWRLTIEKPPAFSSCYVKHIITYYTERFKLPREQVIYSNIWTYGGHD